MEDDSHEDQVDSIQWCNRPGPLRFVTGSSDGTARIWTFANLKWNTMILKMDNIVGSNVDVDIQKAIRSDFTIMVATSANTPMTVY